MLLCMQLKSTHPFPSSSGNFEDGAHIWWLLRRLPALLLSLLRWQVGVARCLRGHMWPPARGRGRCEPWGGRWHPCWWKLLDLLLWHSRCCCLVCASWLCASPLSLSRRGEMRLSSCSGATTSCTQVWQHQMHPFVVGRSKGATGLVHPWAMWDFCRWQGCLHAVQAVRDVRVF